MDRLYGYCREAWNGLGLRPYIALSDSECVVVLLIAGMLCVCFAVVLLVVVRRLRNAARYKTLDILRRDYLIRIQSALVSDTCTATANSFRAPSGSPQWLAIEDTLFKLLEDTALSEKVRVLFMDLGYVHYYQSRLSSRQATHKALAIDKLGRLRYEPAATKLLDRLSPAEKEGSDIIAVTVRALCRIGERDSIKKMFDSLPDVFDRQLISEKTLTTSLLSCDCNVTDLLLGYHGVASFDPRLLSAFLEVLKVLPVDRESYDFASAHLCHSDPEVRVKALKLLASAPADFVPFGDAPILSLLKDPVWFVRLHAVKTLGLHKRWQADDEIGQLTSDDHWQVRSAAAAALASLDEKGFHVIQNILEAADQYAKEAVCREIRNEAFANLLTEKIDSGDPITAEEARKIIELMSSLNFELPLMGMLQDNGTHIQPDVMKSSTNEA